jgi:hypothetical protein
MSKKKVIAVIKGGIGNQLFCYAAAKRLAEVNNASLIIDNNYGFERDFTYKRKYQLNHFNVKDKVLKYNRLNFFIRQYRRLKKAINQYIPYYMRNYITQASNDFDDRLMNFKVRRNVIIEGYWQSEMYFKDIEHIIRQDLKIIPPNDVLNVDLANRINNSNAVCIHVRWFTPPNQMNEHDTNNMNFNYYLRSIQLINKKITKPYFYIFSDYPDETLKMLQLKKEESFVVNINKGDDSAYADLWLMTLCKHFIISNSTFSWWGAWLSSNVNKVVIAPKDEKNGVSSWGFNGLIPESWITI